VRGARAARGIFAYDQYEEGDIGKQLDAHYFAASRPEPGRAFSQALGHAGFALRRSADPATTRHELAIRAREVLKG
jgi:hypothetical protein